jgi:hypothetical protein
MPFSSGEEIEADIDYHIQVFYECVEPLAG